MADIIYNSALLKIPTGSIDLDTDTFYILLTDASYTPDRDAHAFRSDITGELPASGGYASGGFALTGLSVVQDNPGDRVVVDANDWSQALTFTGARWAVMYKHRGGAASADELIKAFDFGSALSADAGVANFEIRFGIDGVLTLYQGV